MATLTAADLTEEEIRLLRQLDDNGGGAAQMSGMKDQTGLDRLIEGGFVLAQSISLDAIECTITPAGNSALNDIGDLARVRRHSI